MRKCIILALSILSACSCGTLPDKPIKVIKGTDKYMNCFQLDSEILDTKTLLEFNLSRREVAESYTKYPSCLPFTVLELEKNINQLSNRWQYLEELKKAKKCKS